MSAQPKFAPFVAALRELCRKHGVLLCCDRFEALQVWPATGNPGEELLYFSEVLDRTDGAHPAIEALGGSLSADEERLSRRLAMESPS